MALKDIGIIIYNSKNIALANTIKNNLYEVFKEYAKVSVHFLDGMNKDSKIDCDAFLVMTQSKVSEVKDHVKDIKKLVIATRTVSEEAIYKLYSIPEGTKILVVNDSLETANETVTLLYQLGLNHLNLVPYNGIDIDDFNIAITPSELGYVPSGIKTVIDIGHRRLDTQTFLNLINLLDLSNTHISQNLVRYMQNITEKNTGIRERYLSSYLVSETLEKVVQTSNEGILIVDTRYDVVYGNNKTSDILKAKIIKGKDIESHINEPLSQRLRQDTFKQELLNIHNEDILVTKLALYTLGEKSGYYFNFNPAKNINKMGTDLNKQLKKKGLFARYSFDNIIYKSEFMDTCINNAKKIALTDYTVLIRGDTGTGKELFAQSIHNYSRRSNSPFVAINCAALPESLLESELFGYEGGAFTGSKKEGKFGLFEQANKGTIFLDEIGDMPLSLQSRLLRVIQEKQIMRIGSNTVIDIDVRIIAATNKDLKHQVEIGDFREDLFYRLNVLPVILPPLRDRSEDIIPLFKHYIEEDHVHLTSEVEQHIKGYSWPGNIRELRNAADYFRIMKNVDNIISTIQTPHDKSTIQVINYEFPVGIDTAIAIMDILMEYKMKSEGIGRSKLISQLLISGNSISENRLEKLLLYLKNKDYIIRNRGRSGVQLTDKGIELFSELNSLR